MDSCPHELERCVRGDTNSDIHEKGEQKYLPFSYIWKGMKNAIVRLDSESATSTSINLDGMEDYVKDISAIGDKIVVGTDAGVYYKSWESFLNKQKLSP